jgi:hypothetical protein
MGAALPASALGIELAGVEDAKDVDRIRRDLVDNDVVRMRYDFPRAGYAPRTTAVRKMPSTSETINDEILRFSSPRLWASRSVVRAR